MDVDCADEGKGQIFDPSNLPFLLKQYYQRCFPFKEYFKWLSYGDLAYFQKREFSFTLKDDVYVRYQCFQTRGDLEKAVKETCPYKIDIGAVFNMKPSLHKQTTELKAMEKELVFDIDISDYDNVRTCCSGAKICETCWVLMTVAIRIVDRTLSEDFGFKHRLWVYSGRRGIHCWEARSAVASYMNGGEKLRRVHLGSNSSTLHHSLRDAVGPIDKYFMKNVISSFGQNLLGTQKGMEAVLTCLDDLPKLVERLRLVWSDNMTSEQRWAELVAARKELCKAHNHLEDEIKFTFLYPRLDVNVSIGVNHLLKSPFVAHPKTGHICVPIDASNPDKFSPFVVPDLADLIGELDETGGDGLKSSLMRPYMEVFDRFLRGITAENEELRPQLRSQRIDANDQLLEL